eukprot:s6773_g6.t1
MMRKKTKVIMMMKVSTTHMVEGPILDLMMGVQEKVLQDEDDEVPVLIHLSPDGEDPDGGIDVKLGVAMSAMLRAGSDKAAELYLEVNRKANDYVRSYDGKIIKGRQIIAMMYESFRTRDRLDMIVSLDYLVKLQFQGDNKLHQFKQTWLEILNLTNISFEALSVL